MVIRSYTRSNNEKRGLSAFTNLRRCLLLLGVLGIFLFGNQKANAQCSGSQIQVQIEVIANGGLTGDMLWEFENFSTNTMVADTSCGVYGPSTTTQVCVNPGDQYVFRAIDDFGDGWGSDNEYIITYAGTGDTIVHKENPASGLYDVSAPSCTWGSSNTIEDTFTFTPQCGLAVGNPQVNNITANSAQINWNASSGTNSSWTVAYGNKGFSIGNGTQVSVSNSSNTTLTGLSQATNYDVYVAENCGGGQTDIFKGPISFGTPCPTYSLPFNEDFSSGNFPACWSRSDNSYVSIENSCGGFNDVMNIEDDQQATTASIDATSANSVKVSYNVGGGVCNDDPEETLNVEYWDGSQWVLAKSYKDDFAFFKDSFYVTPGNLTSNFQVRFDMTGGASTLDDYHIDDVLIEEGPACLFPEDPQFRAGPSWVDLSWTRRTGNETIIQWGSDGFTLGNGQQTASANTTTFIDGLSTSSSYDIYIASVCGNDTSMFVGPISFQTECIQKTPYMVDFENASGTTPPNCWINVDGESGEDWEFEDETSRTPDDNDGDHTFGPGNGGTMAFLDGSDDADSTIMESPWLDLSTFSKEAMVFWMWSETESGSREDFPIRIDVETKKGVNYGVKTFDVENSGWEKFVVDLSGFDDTVKIRFNGQDLDGSFHKDPAIDDIQFGPLDDLQAEAFVGPNQNCNLTSNENVTASFQNSGLDTITSGANLDVFYQIEGQQSPVSENVTLNQDVLPNDTFHYQFSNNEDFSVDDTVYNVEIWHNWSSDALSANDSTADSLVKYRKSEILSTTGDSVCSSRSATVSAKSSMGSNYSYPITWYDQNLNPVYTGDTFKTGSLTSDTSFYLIANNEPVATNAGLSNYQDGFSFNTTGVGLLFDASEKIVIDSIKVYSTSSGTIEITIQDANGNVIGTTQSSVQGTGSNQGERIPVGITVPVGTNHEMLLSSISNTELYADYNPFSGAVNYPYDNKYFNITDARGNSDFLIYFFDWEVSLADCTSDIDTVDVDVKPVPEAGFTSSDEEACALDTVSFNDTSKFSGNASQLNYQWNISAQDVSTKADLDYAFPQSQGQYSVKQSVQSDFGCTDTASLPVQINAKPQAGIQTPEGCTGQTLQFQDSTTFPGFGSLNYDWEITNSQYQVADPTHTFNTSGSKDVSLTVTSSEGCVDSTDAQASVNPTPDVQYTVNDACAEDQVQFNDNTSFNGSPNDLNYVWRFGDGNNSNDDGSVSHAYDTMGQYQTSLKVTSDEGCMDTANEGLTINALPKPDFNYMNTCKEREVSLTNNTNFAGDTANLSYTWTLEGQSVNVREAAYQFSNAQQYNVDLQATNSNGNCSQTVSRIVDVEPQPSAAFSFSDICAGDTAEFSYDGNNPAGSYAWTMGTNNVTASVANPSYSYNQAGSYNVNLEVSYYQGRCSLDSTQVIDVNAVPQAQFRFANNALCPGDTMKVVNNTSFSGDANNLNYQWNFGNMGSESGESPTYVFNSGGTYPVDLTVTTNEGCEDDANRMKLVNNKPQSDFTHSLTGAGQRTFNASNTTYANYMWSFGDGSTSQGPTKAHTYDSNGSYDVELKVVNRDGCTSTTSESVSIGNTGFESGDASANQMEVYPNPFQETTNIRYHVDQAAPVELEIFGPDGKEVISKSYNNLRAGDYSFEFTADSEDAAGSVYFIRLQIGDEVYNKRVVRVQ